MSKPTLQVRTVILSDVHLGTPDSKADEVCHFLKHVQCERLILNGDIVDGWRLKRGGSWAKSHTRFIRLVLKKIEKQNTQVIYLRGNHDDFLGRLLPMQFERLSFGEDFVLDTAQGRYLVLHGDVFDGVVKNLVLLAHVGDAGYALLLRLNRLYNLFRAWRGQGYFSLSQAVKARVKQAVSFISSFEDQLAALARDRGCRGVICGHIHTPANKHLGDIHYLNSGDWVESLTAIVEHHDGRFELIDYQRFVRQFPRSAPDTDALENEEPLRLPVLA
ncbi:MAG: UDP-2,3-diacylglucosamine diphosphatase [Opitutae bacterium]|nr:UDP-2,3-diacylglucosamine diphosphatase [Opitutae bacterium]